MVGPAARNPERRAFQKTWMPGAKAGHDEKRMMSEKNPLYALARSGKTASILVFSVAALNGLTM